MATIIIDGRTRVSFCTAVANVSAPTTTELNAGTALEGLIRLDGLDVGMTTGRVDNSSLASTFNTERVGRKKPQISITFHHDTVDTVWGLLTYRTTGFLVIRMGVDRTTAWTSTQKVKVYPIECGEYSDEKPAPDSNWDYTLDFAVTADPDQRAVVA